MNWYKNINIFKFAAAKSKIQRYGIAKPSVRFFIHRYEDKIPWDKAEKIKSAGGDVSQYIQEYITSNLMPELTKQIDPTRDSDGIRLGENFMKLDFITEEDAIQELHHTEVAQGMTPSPHYSDAMVQKARMMMVDNTNNEKEEQFNNWWGYMNEEDAYSNDPAFKYSILKPIIDSSPPNKKASSPPLNGEIIAGIWSEINTNGVEQMNIIKKYRKLSMEAERKRAEDEGVEISEKGGHWVRIKGGKNVKNKQELEENMLRLKTLSQGTQWCTASGNERIYLPQGDFYLYLENDKAVVAIRCVGNRVQEIRGYNNKQKHLDPYWEEVISFLKTTNLDYQNNEFYKLLKRIERKNVELVEGTPLYYEVLAEIQKNHKEYLTLSDLNKKKFIEFRQAAAIGYRREIEEALGEIERVDLDGAQYLYKFDRFQEIYNEVPEEIMPLLGDIDERVLEVHRMALANNPTLFTEFPPHIRNQFSPEEQDNAWLLYVKADPYHYNDPRIPADTKAKIPIESVQAEFEKLISNNPDHLDYIKDDILNSFTVGVIENAVLEDLERFPVSRVFGRLNKIERVEKFIAKGRISREQFISTLSAAISRNPKWMRALPEEYQQEINANGGNISGLVLEEKKNDVIRNVGSFRNFSIEDQEALLSKYGAEIGIAFGETAKLQNGLLNYFWESVPENARKYLPYSIVEDTANYYANLVNQNPSNKEEMLKIIPTDIFPFVFSKIASRKNWYKKAIHQKEADNWIITKLVSVFGTAAVLALLGMHGLSKAELSRMYEENPQQVIQQIQQITQYPDQNKGMSEVSLINKLEEGKGEIPEAPSKAEPVEHSQNLGSGDINLNKIWQIESTSGTDPDMHEPNSDGALGHFQFLKNTWNECVGMMGKNWDWRSGALDYNKSIQVADFYFNKRIPSMLKTFGIPDTTKTRIACYSWGIGHLKQAWEEYGENWEQVAPKETTDYFIKYGL